MTSQRTGTQLPLDTRPDCGKVTAIPAGTTSYHFKQTADYQVCTPNPAQVRRDIPRCTTQGLPGLPSGLYLFKVEFFIAGLPTPTPIPLTVTSSP